MIALFFTLLIVCPMCFGHPPADADFGKLNPDAPAETAQYGFLVGEWSCKTRFLRIDGSSEYITGEATWTGRFILDGWAIQDDWVSVRPDGSTFHGTNIRSFDVETGKWDNRWLPMGTLKWKSFVSEMRGDTMVMVGGEGSDARGAYVDRNTFYEIEPDRWRWRKDRSYDGGSTWVEEIGFIEATRAK
jgi:hypothetical protein